MDRGTRHGAGAGSSAPCRCWQRTPSALPAAPRTIAPPNRPVRTQDALSAGSPQRPCRAGRYPQGPHGNKRTLRRLERRLTGPIAPCERRLRGPRPPTPEPCLILRSAGGWPADRTVSAQYAQSLSCIMPPTGAAHERQVNRRRQSWDVHLPDALGSQRGQGR